ncbi:hypothetical protein HMPREF9440_00005 [Sutterella parvirubra YIT 11816]|uniref:Uncharacterized protein n=1 Tax=Sutterella parvirubra YIT 11816 TaxID=762967 RepID=H3KBB1_9BURK|nr:hypothetical protein HMPREF9440_00005 [Sutterella parvirubra YIT 11816]
MFRFSHGFDPLLDARTLTQSGLSRWGMGEKTLFENLWITMWISAFARFPLPYPPHVKERELSTYTR